MISKKIKQKIKYIITGLGISGIIYATIIIQISRGQYGSKNY